MSNIGVHLGAWAWAVYQGSHIPDSDWAKLDTLRSAGINTVKYMLYEGSPKTQFEDIRRLRQERSIENIVLRLMHGPKLITPADYLALYRERIEYALSVIPNVYIQPLNEPNLELSNWQPENLAKWFVDFGAVARAAIPGAKLISPPLAPHAPNTWAWWDGMRAAVDTANIVGIHVYANSNAQLTGDYSLSWWLGQVPNRDVMVLETGCTTGTDPITRSVVLPKLYTQLANNPRVQYFFPFILSSEGMEHQEHWLKEIDINNLRSLAQGIIPPVVPEQPNPFPGEITIPINGTRMVFKVTLERIE